jgi:hypothetical protein
VGDPCINEGRLIRLEVQGTSTSEALDRLESKMDQVLDRVNHISVLEAERIHHSEAFGRAFARIEANEKATADLLAVANRAKGAFKAIYLLWGATGLSLAGIAAKVLGL